MDVVYAFKSDSLENNELLRYSIRSLYEYMLDLRNVYVVGDFPGFLVGGSHIPASDNFPKGWQNVHKKVRIACQKEELSDDFLFMNDDFFMLENFEGRNLPFYALMGASTGQSGLVYYGIHKPIRYNKKMYLEMPLLPEMKGDYSPRSFYCNLYGAPAEYTKDEVVRDFGEKTNFAEQFQGKKSISCNDALSGNKKFMEFLARRFPSKSEIEV